MTEFYDWLYKVKKIMKNAGYSEYKTDFKSFITKEFPKNLELYKNKNFEDQSWYQHYLIFKKNV